MRRLIYRTHGALIEHTVKKLFKFYDRRILVKTLYGFNQALGLLSSSRRARRFLLGHTQCDLNAHGLLKIVTQGLTKLLLVRIVIEAVVVAIDKKI